MQLSYFADYALRVLIYGAAHPGRWCTSEEVATAFGISRNHIVKVVHALQRQGYLETVRGRGGGFRLARAPETVSVGDIVRKNEASLAVVECFDPARNTCPLVPACGLKSVLHEASDAFLAVLDRHSLADLVRQPRWSARLLAIGRR